MQGLDIAIAGCGPGGLAAALLLRRDGHRVRIFERFETPRPIGSGLMIQPTGAAVLRELGLLDRLVARSARIERLFGLSRTRAALDVRYAALGPDAGFGLGTHRAVLFEILFDAVSAAGITVETGRHVQGSAVDGGCRVLAFIGGAKAGPFDLVIDASGSSTVLAAPTGKPLDYGALWATLDWPEEASFDEHALEQRYDRASVMAGVLPLGAAFGGTRHVAFFWSLRADGLAAWHERGLEAWKADVVALWPETRGLLDQISDARQLTFARYAHRTLARPVSDALVHVGDAWHSASPQLGQGANMALLDAHALAVALRDARSVEAGLRAYVRLRRDHVRLYQLMSALFTPVYQSDSRVLPFLRDRLVGALARRWPASWITASMVSGLIGDPLTSLGLSSPPDRRSGNRAAPR